MSERKPVSASVRFQVLQRDGYACQCCGAKAPNATLQVDHIRPVAAGGGNEFANLRTLCITCNLGKSDMPAGPALNVVPIRRAAGPVLRFPDALEMEIKNRGEPLSEPLLWVGLQWAVTPYGVECRDGTYCIEAGRLWESDRWGGWTRHMGGKTWVDRHDFEAAYEWAREHFAHLKPAKRGAE